MKFETNKEKGNSGLGLAIAYYATHGCTVSIPLNDTQDYDLVVEKEGKLLKVQVKATGQRSEHGYSIVTVRSCGGTNGHTYKTVRDTDIDLLFIVTELQEMYEIPITEITTNNTINLGPTKQQFRVDNLPVTYEKATPNKEVKEKIDPKEAHLEAMKKRRTVERPSAIELAQDILNTSFCAVGRKYGVTDNSIRKWCITYNMPIKKQELKEWLTNQLDQ